MRTWDETNSNVQNRSVYNTGRYPTQPNPPRQRSRSLLRSSRAAQAQILERDQGQAATRLPPKGRYSLHKMREMKNQKNGLNSVGVRTKFYFQFITTPTSDTAGTTFLLHFDSKRYIIGEVSEGTQRACIQRGVGLRKVRGLFLAGKTAWNNGGVIGLILTLADVQQSEVDLEDSTRRPRLHIHAGPKQLHSLACARRFVFRTGMPLSVHEFDVHDPSQETQPIHEDENIRVWAMALQGTLASRRASSEGEKTYATDSDGEVESPAMKPEQAKLDSDQGLRKRIVNNMFDSDWNRDQLVQSKLKDIKLPAVVWVRDPETKTLTPHTCFDIHNTAPLTPETDVLVRTPWPASTVEELPPASGLPGKVAMSYIIKGHAQRGSFSPKKAKELGLKPGPKFSALVAGKPVESDDGKHTIITPEMVLEPTRPGRGIAIFSIPSTEYLDDLERQLESQQDQLLEGVEGAVWLTRGRVAQSEQFQRLLDRLKDMKHVISDPDICNDYITHDSSALSSARLSNIASNFFSVPRHDNSRGYHSSAAEQAAGARLALSERGVLPAKRGMKIQIEPSFLIDESEVAENLTFDQVHIKAEVEEKLPEDISSYRNTPSPSSSSLDLEEPEIITLGTGSAAPSKYRNVSATLLRMPNGMGNYLFDCGEGTLGQLKRLYTAEQLDEILFNLQGVWISHLHADHHLGTMSVLRAVFEIRKRLGRQGTPRPSPPCLISEINMMDYVDDYQSVLGIPTELLCTPVACHWQHGVSVRGKPFEFQQIDVPIKELRTVKVNHCHGAQAVAVTFSNGFKFSYSGDCRPNEMFCVIGADSDVLVHEATFDDGMEGDARAKKHCTTGEAVGVAVGMRAKNLILTHFSQRYQKLPVLSSVKMPEPVSAEELIDDVDAEMTAATNDEESSDPDAAAETTAQMASSNSTWNEPDAAGNLNIGVAFDLMRVRVSQIASMKKLFPAITKMFELEEEAREAARREALAAQLEELERKRELKDQGKVLRQQKNLKAQQLANEAKRQEKEKKKAMHVQSQNDGAQGSDTHGPGKVENRVEGAGEKTLLHAPHRARENAKRAQTDGGDGDCGHLSQHGNVAGKETEGPAHQPQSEGSQAEEHGELRTLSGEHGEQQVGSPGKRRKTNR